MAFIPLAKVSDGILRPGIRFGQQHPSRIVFVHVLAQFLEEAMGFRQVLAGRAFPFVEVRNGVETERIDPQLHPEVERFQQSVVNGRIVEIEIGLVRVEPVPVVRLRDGIPGPVRRLEILEDDACVRIPVGSIAPDVKVAPGASRFGFP